MADPRLPDLPKEWLQDIVRRHPYAWAKHVYLTTLQAFHDQGYRNIAPGLVMLEDSVVIFATPEGFEHGIRTYAGTAWMSPPQGTRFVRIDPYDAAYPDQNHYAHNFQRDKRI
jgi:hypothetical protein